MARALANNEIDAFEDEIVSRLDSLPVHNAENLRNTRREFSRKLKAEPPEFVLALGIRLVDRSQFRFRFMAYELILKHKLALKSVDAKLLTRLGKGLDSWSAVDTFGCYVAGPAWKGNQISDELIERWALSHDRWWRRAALVSTIPLNSRVSSSDAASRTIRICKMLINDRDDMVIKAMSWALRQLAKRQPSTVQDFLKQYDRNLAARVRREVGNKLRTGLKNPGKSQEQDGRILRKTAR